jgi:hypothetical protein
MDLGKRGPLWWRDFWWKRAAAKRRQQAAKIQADLADLARRRGWVGGPGNWRERGATMVRLAVRIGGGSVGLALGGALWPFWWPEWTGWLFLAAGTTLGLLLASLAAWRWLA